MSNVNIIKVKGAVQTKEIEAFSEPRLAFVNYLAHRERVDVLGSVCNDGGRMAARFQSGQVLFIPQSRITYIGVE